MISIGFVKPAGMFIEHVEVFLASSKKDLGNPKSKPIIIADITYSDYNGRMANTYNDKFRVELDAEKFICDKKEYEFLNGDYIIGQIELMLEEFFEKI